MGCCFSRPAGPNSPYPGGAPSTSTRAINSPRLGPQAANNDGARSPQAVARPRPQAQPSDTRMPPSQTPRRIRIADDQPLSQHIDKPLRRHEWSSRRRTWSRGQLIKERTDFFETRVTGRPEIWQTIRAALNIMWESDASRRSGAVTEEDSSAALATAQTILSAAEITLPSGDLANGVYDALGNYYPLPEWIVSDPTNAVESDDEATEMNRERKAKQSKATAEAEGADEAGEEEEEDEEAARARREEKGKGVADERELVKLRARPSEGDRDVTVSVSPSETVRSVARKILDEAGLPAATKRVRVAYMGKILKETGTLESQGWQPGHVVNALVFSH